MAKKKKITDEEVEITSSDLFDEDAEFFSASYTGEVEDTLFSALSATTTPEPHPHGDADRRRRLRHLGII